MGYFFEQFDRDAEGKPNHCIVGARLTATITIWAPVLCRLTELENSIANQLTQSLLQVSCYGAAALRKGMHPQPLRVV